MKVIKPITIQPEMLISSSAVESVAVWSSGGTYSLGATARLDGNVNRIYEYVSTTPGNSTVPPDEDVLELTPKWMDAGPTNKWAVFDQQVNTTTKITNTSAPTELIYVLEPGLCNSIALFNITGADTVKVQLKENSSATYFVYEKTVLLDATSITDWYDYFFEPKVPKDDAAFLDIPPYYFGQVIITITGPQNNEVSCGVIAIGNKVFIGHTQWGAGGELIDYSRKETDDFGTTTFVKRPYSKRSTATMLVENEKLTKTQFTLAELRATPCAWLLTDDSLYNAINVYGFYRNFTTEVRHPTHSFCSIEIEGLI